MASIKIYSKEQTDALLPTSEQLVPTLGTAGQVLTVNSGATGTEWVTPSAGINVVQSTGSSTSDVMSQKAVTDNLPSSSQLVPSTSGATTGDVLTFNGSSIEWDAPSISETIYDFSEPCDSFTGISLTPWTISTQNQTRINVPYGGIIKNNVKQKLYNSYYNSATGGSNRSMLSISPRVSNISTYIRNVMDGTTNKIVKFRILVTEKSKNELFDSSSTNSPFVAYGTGYKSWCYDVDNDIFYLDSSRYANASTSGWTIQYSDVITSISSSYSGSSANAFMIDVEVLDKM